MARSAAAKQASKENPSGEDAKSKGAERWREIRALALLLATAFLFISVYNEQIVLQNNGQHICGPIGEALGYWFLMSFGIAPTYFFLVLLAIWSGASFFRQSIQGWSLRVIGAALLIPALAIFEYLIVDQATYSLPDLSPGGSFGWYLGDQLLAGADRFGSYLIAGFVGLVGFILCTDILISPLLMYLFRKSPAWANAVSKRVPGAISKVQEYSRRVIPTKEEREKAEKEKAKKEKAEKAAAKKIAAKLEAEKKAEAKKAKAAKKGAVLEEAEAEEEQEDWEEDAEGEEQWDEDEEGQEEEWDEEDEELEDDEEEDEEWDEDEEEDEEAEDWEEEEDDEEEPAVESKPARVIRLSAQKVEQADDTKFAVSEEQLQFSGCYNIPTLGLLPDPPIVKEEQSKEELDAVAEKIERTLESFKIEARVGNIQNGPVITLYEVSLAAGIKVGKISGLSDDLAMALSARSIRVVAPIPGKSTVGIEVPNKTRKTVHVKELLSCKVAREGDAQIPLMLGKDAAGDPIIEDLTRMPHLLIAGSTGSGKSVCINSILASMLMSMTPATLKLILVDPKMVELSLFEDIPHLLTPVITDMKKAPAALDWAVRTMESRYELLSKAEVRHIDSYNELDKQERFDRMSTKMSHEEAEKAPERLPFIVIIIDELADMMMTASKEVEASIIRLCQKSRAVGIHVILATQRPSVDVITGLIKSNLPCRIAFKVASRVDSRTILDQIGSERLLGQGDMLYLAPGTSALERAQCSFISDRDVKKLVKYWRKESKPEFNKDIQGFLEKGTAGGNDDAVDDDLFPEAVRVVLETQRGSASLLQRRLGVGYTRASRLMDIMGEKGIVGAYKGSKAREVNFTLEEWEEANAS